MSIKLRRWSDKEVSFLERNYPELTANVIAEKLGRSEVAVRSKIERTEKVRRRSRKVRAMREYTLYKGDKILCKGTLKEISAEMGLEMNRLQYLKSPSTIKRDKGNTTVLLLNEED